MSKSEALKRSPTTRAVKVAAIRGSSEEASFEISQTITVREIVIRVTPPKKAAAPTSA